jgi:hypothetical protein
VPVKRATILVEAMFLLCLAKPGFTSTSARQPEAHDDDRTSVKAFAGWSRDWLYGIPLTLTTIEVGPGGTVHKPDYAGDGHIMVAYSRGSSPAGLSVQEFIVRPSAQLRFSRFVMGAGVRLGYFHMARATQGALEAAIIGPQLWVGVEPIVWDDHAIFLEARAHADVFWGVDKTHSWHVWFDGLGPGLPGVTLGGGFRY